jgi:hypothetical protein
MDQGPPKLLLYCSRLPQLLQSGGVSLRFQPGL